MKGHITRGRIPGTWYLRVELPRVSTGKRRQRRETFRGTKSDAERRLRQLLDDLPSHASEQRLTVATLCERWLDSTRHRVGHKTYQRYASIVRLYLRASLGSLRADMLTPAQVECALGSWITGSRNDRESGRLSPRTVKHILDTLKTAYRWAVRMGLATRNPVEVISSPRVQRREMRALTPVEVAQLLHTARGTELEFPIIAAVGTGLRRGELLGLRRSDVDLTNARLVVRRSLETVGRTVCTKPPKTARSARTISLPGFVVNALQRRIDEQDAQRKLLGLPTESDQWVFTRADESPWEPGAFSLMFARLVKRHKMPHVRFHDLRHTFGTLALASGVDLKSVSAALGHSSISITANVYVHAVEALQRDAADRIDALLGSSVSPTVPLPFPTAVPQRCHTPLAETKNARQIRRLVVAPTGIEPVFPP